MSAAHEGWVYARRIRALTGHFAELLPRDARVLDVGSGDGLLAARVRQARPDLEIEGIDVLLRERTHIPVSAYDGTTFPFDDGAVDAVTFVDVLHHTADPTVLLREAARVARRAVLIKDHLCEGRIDHATLRFMDRVGNARHGVALPYNYWPERRWREAFADCALEAREWRTELGLYAPPLDRLFGRSLHFIARFRPGARTVPARSTGNRP